MRGAPYLLATGDSGTDFWRCKNVVRDRLHCHQCNYLHMTTEKTHRCPQVRTDGPPVNASDFWRWVSPPTGNPRSTIAGYQWWMLTLEVSLFRVDEFFKFYESYQHWEIKLFMITTSRIYISPIITCLFTQILSVCVCVCFFFII